MWRLERLFRFSPALETGGEGKASLGAVEGVIVQPRVELLLAFE